MALSENGAVVEVVAGGRPVELEYETVEAGMLAGANRGQRGWRDAGSLPGVLGQRSPCDTAVGRGRRSGPGAHEAKAGCQEGEGSNHADL